MSQQNSNIYVTLVIHFHYYKYIRKTYINTQLINRNSAI